MLIVQEILYRGLEAYVLVIIAQILFSFFPVQPGSQLHRVTMFLTRLTDPVFVPLRRIIPPISFGGSALDLSPLIVLLVIQVFLIPLVKPL